MVLVVLGDQLGIPVGDLFLGSLIPGLMMAGAFALYVLIVAYLKPEVAPALPDRIELVVKVTSASSNCNATSSYTNRTGIR